MTEKSLGIVYLIESYYSSYSKKEVKNQVY